MYTAALHQFTKRGQRLICNIIALVKTRMKDACLFFAKYESENSQMKNHGVFAIRARLTFNTYSIAPNKEPKITRRETESEKLKGAIAFAFPFYINYFANFGRSKGRTRLSTMGGRGRRDYDDEYFSVN